MLGQSAIGVSTKANQISNYKAAVDRNLSDMEQLDRIRRSEAFSGNPETAKPLCRDPIAAETV
jgi:hypothetical protein